MSEDAKTIAKAPGIGVKTAKKMILELKDKLDLEDAFEKKLLHEQEAEETLPDARGEAVEALTALGYSLCVPCRRWSREMIWTPRQY